MTSKDAELVPHVQPASYWPERRIYKLTENQLRQAVADWLVKRGQADGQSATVTVSQGFGRDGDWSGVTAIIEGRE